ncbi:xylosyl- and glucuronyltransferase [Seminavis robusta]|uniref:Xylosyl- and glucuronyltransferase n=1 Tax=Seminavis robusta TaxID=568900 RepID=A0A9N8F330_9STRA|nr:xylosyl- and glucuronyltransferase [Seminavis robusta]|eukprot:Sro2979_g341480.1 xylosyl- and glucuronyltransferase (711) ;mRNA; r:7184-9316
MGDMSSPGHRRRVVVVPTAEVLDSASSSTLLPSTFQRSSWSQQRAATTNTTSHSNPLTSFLLGGTYDYYPGKDKKRTKRRTMWYRLFCASKWRRATSLCILSYLLVNHGMRPLWSAVVDYSKLIFPRRRKGLHGTWLLYDESLLSSIRTVEQERASATRLAKRQHELQSSSSQSSQQQPPLHVLLERIVPGWYHRNDAEGVVEQKLRELEQQQQQQQQPQQEREEPNDNNKHNDKQSEEANHQKSNSRHAKKEEDTSHHQHGKSNDKPEEEIMRHQSNPHRNQQNNGKDTKKKKTDNQQQPKRSDHHPVVETDKRRLATNPSLDIINSTSGVRTIHNMHLFRNQTSSCPTIASTEELAVTLVLQSTMERLWILEKTCQRWKSPILLVLAVPSSLEDDSSTTTAIIQAACPQLVIIRHALQGDENDHDLYPVNRLRNLGLDQVQTSHVLVADIDFVPSVDLDTLIRKTIQARRHSWRNKNQTSLEEHREALVVPAFERIPPAELCDNDKNNNCAKDTQESLSKLVLPSSFTELHKCVLEEKQCRVFQSNNNWDGHSSTRSKDWLNGTWYDDTKTTTTDNTPLIRTLNCFDSVRYEPYVVLRWCPGTTTTIMNGGPVQQVAAPYYDERFHGYGKNKIELISHLRIMGYSFAILPEGFIIHSPHATSKAKKAWESTKDSSLHRQMDSLYPKFLKELVAMYKQQHEHHRIIKQC